MTIAEQFVMYVIEKGYHVSCAESCTGGKLTGAIVDVADASQILDASIVTYSNEAKMKYLGVKEETLKAFGAVSEETAREMAEGIARANNAQIGLSVTGTAGQGVEQRRNQWELYVLVFLSMERVIQSESSLVIWGEMLFERKVYPFLWKRHWNC